jgi:hypothetical protein
MPFELHAVIIDRRIPLEKAKQIAQDIIKDKSKTFYRITENSYRFRNIPKTKFKPETFRSKTTNDKITLIFGDLK